MRTSPQRLLLHPLQTETTYWIVARNDTMAMSFSFLVLILWSKPASVQRDILGGLCILLALGSKETAFVFWPLLLVLVWFKRIGLSSLRILLSIAVTVGFLAYRAFVLPSNVFPPFERWHFLFGHTQDWLTYMLGKLILPVPLASHMPIGWLQIHWHLLLGTGVLLVLFLIAMLRFSRLVLLLGAICIVFSILSVLPSLAQHGLIGDRYLGLALFGTCLWLAALPLFHRQWLFILILPMAYLSTQRGEDWQSDLHIWQAAHRDHPSSFTEVSLAISITTANHLIWRTVITLQAIRLRNPI